MALLNWIAQVRELSAAALTVRVQQLDPTLQNRLLWDQFFPRRDVDSTELDEILNELVEKQYVSERREWNTRGRPIPMQSPAREKLEFIPIETYFRVEEKEINDLLLRFAGNQALMQQQIGPKIPQRTDRIAAANFRRIEKDSFDGWSGGVVTRRNPQLGHVAQTFDFQFAATRYPTALVAWNDPSINAYQELLKAVRFADQKIGPCGGIMLRQATWDAIEVDATAAVAINFSPTVLMDRAQVEARLRSDLGGRQFVVIIFEDTLEVFLDGGLTNTGIVNRWPAEKIGFIPAANGGAIGFTAFAPVARAYDLTSQVPNAGIDIRGNTVYHEVANGGRELIVECQMNAFPVPNENLVFVMDVGV